MGVTEGNSEGYADTEGAAEFDEFPELLGTVVGVVGSVVGPAEGANNELGTKLIVGAIVGVPVTFVSNSLGESDTVGNSVTIVVGVNDTEGV